MLVGDILEVSLDATGDGDLTEDQEDDGMEDKEGALGIAEGHANLEEVFWRSKCSKLYQELNTIKGDLNQKESTDVNEGSDDIIKDIKDVEIDTFIKTTANK